VKSTGKLQDIRLPQSSVNGLPPPAGTEIRRVEVIVLIRPAAYKL